MTTYKAALETQVYTNATGGITIMQEELGEQVFVVLSIHQAQWLAEELQKLANEGE